MSEAEPGAVNCVPICAIGASAGGVTALQTLFRQIPSDLGLAYVVILHLSPEQPSALTEILSACTSLPVEQVQDAATLAPDRVYVIPPDRELVIEGDDVSARPFSEPRGRRAPIDLFFRSIAAARGDGVAMILSGAGADGAVGVKAVKEAGGVVMVQAPTEAEFASMPQSAIATGAADFVAPVSTLAERLGEVARSKEAVRSLDVDGEANDLRRIVGFLRSRTGHDFAGYKRATVMRRVIRRMQVCRMTSLAGYADHLMTTPEEAKELFADLLISVTMFFRDPRAFEALDRLAVRPLFDDPDALGEEGLRAWVVGCATGEEAYSLAILFLEEVERRKLRTRVQIFATDLDEGALATAREGRYPKAIEADVSEERLARFFVDEGSHYRVRKELREVVLFASHSVLKEPPFMRLDLISCRNLLIYLESGLQEQVRAIFHYGLRRGRYLFLGSAESADGAAELFRTLDRDARIYAAKPISVAAPPPIVPQAPSPERLLRVQARELALNPATPAGGVHVRALEAIAPPSVLVDESQTILHLSETSGRYILHSSGPPSNRLPAVVRPELRLDVKLALDRALQQRLPSTTHPTFVALDGERRCVSLHVAPVPLEGGVGPQALVFFLDGGVAPPEEIDIPEEGLPEEVRRLHAELRALQEALVTSRSGHDATIEDLRATNEELQSTNEEYRSTAEELETSREELQSINEELRTVNAELKSKLESISRAHSDLQNLTAATEIGTLFLDGELRIRMFTPPIATLFSITRIDIGRFVTDFTNRLDYDRLVDDARMVLDELVPAEREVRSVAGRWYVMRMRPYRTVENHIEGAVLTFVDITMRKQAEAALARSEQQLRALVEASSQVIYRMSPDWTEMRQLLGGGLLPDTREPDESWLDHYVPDEDRDAVQSVVQAAIDGRAMFDLEHRVLRLDGTIGWMQSRAIPVMDVDERIVEWFGSAIDTTSRRRAEEALRESEERLRVVVEGVPQLVWRSEPHGGWTWSSPQWTAYTGITEAASQGNGWLEGVHLDDREDVQAAWRAASRDNLFEVECRIRNADTGGVRWFRGRAWPRPSEAGRPIVEWLGTFTDVDDLRSLQDRQRVLLHELQHRVRNTLAVVRSIASRTGETSESVEDFAAHLEGRFNALARTQMVLTSAPGRGVDLESMVREELLAHAASEDQIDIGGPDIQLSAKAAEVLALAVHELATNAVKYGALTSPSGNIVVQWSSHEEDGEPWLRLRWLESGVRVAASAPRREGFGTELVTRRVPYELSGRGAFKLLPGGIRVEIAFPLRPGDSILQTDAPT